jgi:hypothetical protein
MFVTANGGAPPSGSVGGIQMYSFLQNKGDLEKEIVKKGMTKGQANANKSAGYMNN